MDDAEIRLRLIEAAAKNPLPHAEGFAASVQASAAKWYAWVVPKPTTLGLPKKGA